MTREEQEPTTPTEPSPSAWTSWHLHVPRLGMEATDRLLQQVVAPAVGALRSMPWFFVRYWHRGPHIRLRVAGLAPDREDELDRLLRDHLPSALDGAGETLTPEGYRRSAAPLAMAGEGGHALDIGELRPPGVYREPYQPEIGRYGGPALMALSEALFQESSELALAFLRLDRLDAARNGLGVRSTLAALGVLDEERRAGFCQWAAQGWDAWLNNQGMEKGARLDLARLEATPAPAPVTRWADRLGSTMEHWRVAAGQDGAERILHSHIHMLHNRLGLSVAQERTHYRALAQSLVRDPARTGAS